MQYSRCTWYWMVQCGKLAMSKNGMERRRGGGGWKGCGGLPPSPAFCVPILLNQAADTLHERTHPPTPLCKGRSRLSMYIQVQVLVHVSRGRGGGTYSGRDLQGPVQTYTSVGMHL